MRKFGLLLAFLLVVNVFALDIYILHNNDVHGKVLPYTSTRHGQLQKFSSLCGFYTAVKKYRIKAAFEGADIFVVNAGDIFQGTTFGTLTKGEGMIKLFNFIGYNVATFGNHDFDLGWKIAKNMADMAAFPFVCANLKGKFKPLKYVMFYLRNGKKIAFFGLAPQDLKYLVTKKALEGVKVDENTFNVVRKMVKKLRKEKKADLVVLISHLGDELDKKIADTISGIDLIVGGHSHWALFEPYKGRKGALVVRGEPYAETIGVVKITMDDKTGKVIDKTGLVEWLTPDKYPADWKMLEYAKKLYKIVEPLEKQVIATIKFPLVNDMRSWKSDGVYLKATKVGNHYDMVECNFGDLITDVIREKVKADVAFQNEGGIRIPLKPGKVTFSNIFEAFPFENYIVILNMTGKEIKQAIEFGLSFKSGILHQSGLKVKFDMSKPVGHRIVKITLANGKPLLDDKKYKVALNNFLADGGDQFEVFAKIKDRVDTNYKLRDILIEWLKARKVLNDYKIDNRYQEVH